MSIKHASGGVAWTLSAQLAKLVAQLVYMAIMSHILSPTDFGLYAMATPVSALLLMFQDLGIGQAVITQRELSVSLVRQLNSICLLITLVGLSVMLLLISPIEAFYDEERLRPILYVLAASLLPTGLTVVAQARLARKLDFRKLSLIDLGATGIGYVSSIAVACMTEHPASLGVLNLGTAISSLVLISFLLSDNLSFSVPKTESKSVVTVGVQFLLYNIMNFFSRNSDNIIVGKSLGATPLGLYDRSYKLLMLPLQQISSPVSKVIIPILSKNVDCPVDYAKTYILSMVLMITITVPLIVFLNVYADVWFPLAFGREWLPAVQIFRVLSIAGSVQLITSSIGWLFISQRRTREYLALGTINLISSVGAFAFGVQYGVIGVAALYAVTEIIVRLPAAIFIVSRRGHVGVRKLIWLLAWNTGMWAVAYTILRASRLIDFNYPIMTLFIGGVTSLVLLILFTLATASASYRLSLVNENTYRKLTPWRR